MNMMSKSGIFRKWAGGMSLSFLFFSTGLAPVYASDTEVYARSVEVSSGGVTPVLMMVLDSSGSMNFCMDGTEYCEYPRQKRTEVLRNAMRKVLFGNPDSSVGAIIKPSPHYIKMGYARFNPKANDGGWLRYPARELGDYVPYSDPEWTAEPITVEARLSGSADDAVDTNLTGASYAVGGANEIGLRFADLQVPQGATISGATLTFFHAPDPGNIPATVSVQLEESDDALAYSAINTPSTPSVRNYAKATTPSTKVPNKQDTFVTGVVSVDVKSQVSELVARTGWCGGNAMALKVSAAPSETDSFNALSWDGVQGVATDARPRLIVNYTISRTAKTCINAPVDTVIGIKDTLDDVEWTSKVDSVVRHAQESLLPAAIPEAGVTNSAGLRFPTAKILPDATIEGAWLYLTAAKADAAANVTVSVYDAADFPAFCTQNATTKLVDCAKPATPLVSSPTTTLALPTTVGLSGTNLVANVTPLVAAVAAKSGWTADSSIGFHLTNADPASAGSLAEVFAMGAGLSKVAILHVKMRVLFDDMAKFKKSIRQDLYDDIAVRMYADGGTPLGDAYAEAARYMMGMSTLGDKTITTTFGGLLPEQSYYHPDRRTVGTDNLTYQSPIVTGQCTANYLYMMSDGEPSNVSNVVNNSNGLTDTYNANCSAYDPDTDTENVAGRNFSCMMSVAEHMSSGNNQQATKVRTNTVFFDSRAETNADIVDIVHDMKMVGEKFGDGAFFMATDEAKLTESMSQTLSALLDQTGSITAPGVAVNQFNRLTHLDQLYYAVFDPDTGNAHWRGNVKRYKLSFTDTDALIVDQNGDPAIDESSTFFAEDSHSFWSPTVDGNTAVLGGVSSVLPAPPSRKIYTYLAPAYSSNMTLSLLSSYAAATGRAYVPGLTADRQFINLHNWLRGYDIDIVEPATATTPATIKSTNINVGNSTPLRKVLGGVLHSQPVLVNYGYTGTDPVAAQTNADLQKNMVFFSSMEGMLHAANARTGIEAFAFMPKEALATSPRLAINPEQPLPEFGLDLTWTVHRVDANADLQITGTGGSAATEDKVWLFGGMRMGGRNYYALNVTDPTVAPTLKWVIEGGNGVFANLGETWSKPVVGQIKINDTLTDVLFFGGGYDREHEADNFDATVHAGNAMGSQFYIVNANTGEPIWWASNTSAIGTTPHLTVSDMKFSIPAEPKLFDANKDGLVDAVYFGDLGGQVFRLDLDNANTGASGLVPRVQRLANVGQLAGTANEANQRRFYETPSVALMYDSASESSYVAVAMGSGSRSHPLDVDTEDAFYVFRDKDVLRADLATATADSLQSTITTASMAQLDLSLPAGATIGATQQGWWVDFVNSGEKVLSTPLILFGEVFFTTYQPLVDSGDPCSPLIGRSFLWRMSVSDGAATFDFNKDGTVTAKERTESTVQGLGGSPQLLIGDDGKNAIITGTGVERNKDLQSPTMRRTRWFEKTK